MGRTKNISALCVIILCVAISCGKSKPTTETANIPTSVPVDQSLGFRSTDDTLGLKDKANVLIKKPQGFEHEFLLFASFSDVSPAPTSHGTQGKIVTFKLDSLAKKVFMLKSTNGQKVTKSLGDIPETLAVFPVLEETADYVMIDFNSGMDKLYLAENWQATDDGGKQYDATKNAFGLDLKKQRLDSISITGNTLVIHQVAQVNMFIATPTLEIRYFLSPYVENQNIKPKENFDFKKVGFFEVGTTVENAGREVANISRWDFSKPVTFHVSANTPKDYVQAMKDGILYWNKVAGKEILKAEVAPDGVNAPSADYNIVQWVEWDNAGMAYADALSDPRTGETLHGQVFITSVFALLTKERAAKILRRLKNQSRQQASRVTLKSWLDQAKKNKKANPLSDQLLESLLSNERLQKALEPYFKLNEKLAPFFDLADNINLPAQLQSGNLCKYDVNAKMAKGIEALLNSDASDDSVLRFSQDMVRSVVAHEVGHVLGLRHNFAGSLGAKKTIKVQEDAFSEYMLHGIVPHPDNTVFTSSVMDYLTHDVDALTGAQLMLTRSGLEYDRMAFDWGYLDRRPSGEAGEPLFCTDSDFGWDGPIYTDCDRFDKGNNPIEYLAWKTSMKLERLPIELAEFYIHAKTPRDSRDVEKFHEISPDPIEFVEDIMELQQTKLKWFKESLKSLPFERHNLSLLNLNPKEIVKKRYAWVEQKIEEMDEINSNGKKIADGLDKFLFSLLPAQDRSTVTIVEASTKALDKYLEHDYVINGVGEDGKTYHLTQDEISWIKENGKIYFSKIEEKLLEKVLNELRWNRFESPKLLKKVASRYSEIAKALVLSPEEKFELPETFFKNDNSNAKNNIATPEIEFDWQPLHASWWGGTMWVPVPKAEAPVADTTEMVPAPAPSSSPNSLGKTTEKVTIKASLVDSSKALTAVKPLKNFSYKQEVRTSAVGLLNINLGEGEDRLLGWSDDAVLNIHRMLKILVMDTFGIEWKKLKNDDELDEEFDHMSSEKISDSDQKKWFLLQKEILDKIKKSKSSPDKKEHHG
ncbi:MAG: zinc-dependent metalloprotease [Deltaproteobacteria bacterium]|nr:zinc-dependent metalloprotease [Deltaproteobacteria bacterium]